MEIAIFAIIAGWGWNLFMTPDLCEVEIKVNEQISIHDSYEQEDCARMLQADSVEYDAESNMITMNKE